MADRRTLDFLVHLASRLYTAKAAEQDYCHLAVDGVMHRELLAILRCEGTYGPDTVPGVRVGGGGQS